MGPPSSPLPLLDRARRFPVAAALVFAAVALPFLTQVYFAGVVDQIAADREQTVVRNGVESREREMARMLVSETVWDEAVRRMDNTFDAAWVRENIAEYWRSTHHFETVLVLDANDRVQFAARDAVETAAHDDDPVRMAAVPLVAAVRRAEAARGSLAVAVANGRTFGSPILAHGVVDVGGEIMVISASLVQPDFGKAMPRRARAPVVIAGKTVDGAFIDTLRNRYLLNGLTLAPGDAPGARGEARVLLFDPRGAPVATLRWRPPTPGAAMLQRVLGPMLLMASMLCLLGIAVARQGHRAAQELIASERRSHHLAYHDALTGLPNRALFNDWLLNGLERLRRDNTVFAVHCIDLDRFKDVNDTFGHAAGDELIHAVSDRLRKCCRAVDTVARLGGDEFAIVQAQASADTAAALAGRIVDALGQPFELSVGVVHVGCSVGSAVISDASVTQQECLRRADLALYRAKDGGRGRFAFFEVEMDVAYRKRGALREYLRAALANGDLTVVYQTQVDDHGNVGGVEALVRWTHPREGAISPSVFVSLAEESGLIDQLGMFVLRRAFEDSRCWPMLRTAVNVSAAQLRAKDFPEKVEALVGEMRVSPERFEIEITEGLLLGDDPHVLSTLQKLRALGFTIALDDFGTGYSSLSYLQRYPIDKIKIDRSFVANLGVDAEAGEVVSAIVKLAQALGLEVIAEGVETDMQRIHLRAVGCRDMQGFLFGKPLPAAAIAFLAAPERLPARRAEG